MNKCLKNEISRLLPIYPDISTTVTEDGKCTVTFTSKKLDKLQFTCRNYYPFHPPEVLVNGESWCQFIHIDAPFQRLFYKDGLCMCGKTIFDTWSPTLRLQDVVNEINNIQKAKSSVLQKFIFTHSITGVLLVANILTWAQFFSKATCFIIYAYSIVVSLVLRRFQTLVFIKQTW